MPKIEQGTCKIRRNIFKIVTPENDPNINKNSSNNHPNIDEESFKNNPLKCFGTVWRRPRRLEPSSGRLGNCSVPSCDGLGASWSHVEGVLGSSWARLGTD